MLVKNLFSTFCKFSFFPDFEAEKRRDEPSAQCLDYNTQQQKIKTKKKHKKRQTLNTAKLCSTTERWSVRPAFLAVSQALGVGSYLALFHVFFLFYLFKIRQKRTTLQKCEKQDFDQLSAAPAL